MRWLGHVWVERVVCECFEFCAVTVEDCQIDHVQPWAAGGLTVDGNGRAAGGYHNRRRHRRPEPP